MTGGEACTSEVAAIAEARRRYAAAVMPPDRPNPRVEAAFAAVAREDFLTPPPWRVFAPGGDGEGVTSDPLDLYRDVLVVLDPGHGVNNGQPSLHAAWLAAVDPRPGKTVLHIGAGTGYYTAILAELVGPSGRVHAYELLPGLAERASSCLAGLPQVTVHAGTAVGGALPEAEVVYVNARATAPDPAWLNALKPGGRLIFPWQPSPECGGVTLEVTRVPGGFAALPTMAVGFIPCVGAQDQAQRRIGRGALGQTRSLWLTETRPPDRSATAVFDHVWFSKDPVGPAG